MKEKTYKEIVLSKFKFLQKDFNFSIVEFREEYYGYYFIYENSTTGVCISYEMRDAYIDIELYKVSDRINLNLNKLGDPKKYLLEEVLDIRNPQAKVEPAYYYGEDSVYYTKKNGLELYVSRFADNLKEYASDLLSGDFDILKKMSKHQSSLR